MFRLTTRTVVSLDGTLLLLLLLLCSSVFTCIAGNWICHRVIGRAAHVAHSTGLTSQLTIPNDGAVSAVTGSAVSNAAVLFHSASKCAQCPRHVLFPPDMSTIHVSRPSRSGDAREGDGDRTVRQFSVVRGVMLAGGRAVAATGVVVAAASREEARVGRPTEERILRLGTDER